jgi:hypothetical protein
MIKFGDYDQDLAGYGNVKYNTKFLNNDLELSTGGMFRFKSRTSLFDSYLLRCQLNYEMLSRLPKDINRKIIA